MTVGALRDPPNKIRRIERHDEANLRMLREIWVAKLQIGGRQTGCNPPISYLKLVGDEGLEPSASSV
jgi:hypothetical protein